MQEFIDMFVDTSAGKGTAVGDAFGGAAGDAAGEAFGDAFGGAAGEAFGDAFGGAAGEAFGGAFGGAAGEAFGGAFGGAAGGAAGEAFGDAFGGAAGGAAGEAFGDAFGGAAGEAFGDAFGGAAGGAAGGALATLAEQELNEFDLEDCMSPEEMDEFLLGGDPYEVETPPSWEPTDRKKAKKARAIAPPPAFKASGETPLWVTRLKKTGTELINPIPWHRIERHCMEDFEGVETYSEKRWGLPTFLLATAIGDILPRLFLDKPNGVDTQEYTSKPLLELRKELKPYMAKIAKMFKNVALKKTKGGLTPEEYTICQYIDQDTRDITFCKTCRCMRISGECSTNGFSNGDGGLNPCPGPHVLTEDELMANDILLGCIALKVLPKGPIQTMADKRNLVFKPPNGCDGFPTTSRVFYIAAGKGRWPDPVATMTKNIIEVMKDRDARRYQAQRKGKDNQIIKQQANMPYSHFNYYQFRETVYSASDSIATKSGTFVSYDDMIKNWDNMDYWANATEATEQSSKKRAKESSKKRVEQSSKKRVEQAAPWCVDQAAPWCVDQAAPLCVEQAAPLCVEQAAPLCVEQAAPLCARCQVMGCTGCASI